MNYAVVTFDLSTDRRGDAAESKMQGGRVLQVVHLPAGAQDVALRLDDGDYIPVTGLLRLELQTGLFSKITLRNAPSSGTLSIYAGTDPLPFVSGAGASAAHNEFELHWPQYGNNLAGGSATWPVNGQTRWGDMATSAVFWAGKDGVAGDGMSVVKGRLCGFLSMGGGGTSGRGALGASLFPLLTKPAGASFRAPRGIRCWTFQIMIARGALINWTDQTGVALLLSAGAAGGWVGFAGNPGIGIVGDGVGGWKYVSRRGGAYTEQVPLVWPAAQTEWVNVGFQLRSADGARAAEASVYLNDALAVTRSWAAGLLPDFPDLLNSARFLPYVRAGDGALSNALCVATAHASAGPLDITGAEV